MVVVNSLLRFKLEYRLRANFLGVFSGLDKFYLNWFINEMLFIWIFSCVDENYNFLNNK